MLMKPSPQVSAADELLASFCASHPGDALYPSLMRAQLVLEGGGPGGPVAALAALAGIADAGVQTSSAMVATRVTLHEAVGDAEGALSLLQQVRGMRS